MVNLIEVSYNQTGSSKKTNEMGMREMQQKAYSANSAQYLLIKAPPASGKSRALMFIAKNQSVHLLHQRSFQNMAFLQIGIQTHVITFVLRVRIKVKLQHF